MIRLNVLRLMEKRFMRSKSILGFLFTLVVLPFISLTAYATDTTSDLIGKFTFDGNIVNEVTGEEAIVIAKGDNIVGESTDYTFQYTDGVNGSAICFNGEDEVGLDLGIKPSNHKNCTISVWIKSFDINKDSPIVWIGRNAQIDLNFVGIVNNTYYSTNKAADGPVFNSDSRTTSRYLSANADKSPVAIKNIPSSDDNPSMAYDWTNVTIVIEDRVGKIYYDGQFIADTEDYLVHNFFYDGSESTYVGATAWGDSFFGYLDELYMYDRALTDEEVAALVEETNATNVPLGEFEPYAEFIIYYEDSHYDPYSRSSDKVFIWNLWFSLSSNELDNLLEKAHNIAEQYDINIYIEQGDSESWYDSTEGYLEELKVDYGEHFEENTDGIALVINDAYNECEIYVSGELKKRINSYGVELIEDEVESLLYKDKLYEANKKSLSLIGAFEKEADFLLPYMPFINPYINPVWKIITLLIVAVIVILTAYFISKKLRRDEKYSKGRDKSECIEEQTIYYQPPYRIDFKISKDEFIEEIKTHIGLKYVPDDFIKEETYDNIWQLSNRYCVSIVQKTQDDRYRYGWTENKDMCYRMINENTNKAVDELIKAVEPYECTDIEYVGIDKNRGGTEKYVMMPLWMLDIEYNGRLFSFLMNGQTGKFLGQVPLDEKKIKKKIAIIAAATAAGLIVISSFAMIILNFIFTLI